MRNLDVTTLRSFMAVADTGGVTKAAGFLNLTQSAVSMQLKRLEEMLGVTLLDRSARSISLTAEGEQFLGYARRMVTLNDEIVRRLSHQEFEGEITLGVPHDILYPVIPRVLQQFRAAYPRMSIQLISSHSIPLKEKLAKGECDMILTTEPNEGGEELCRMALAWIGAPGGASWRRRPLRFASGRKCMFRGIALDLMDKQGIEWENAVDTESDRSIEVTVAADMAVSVMIAATAPPQLEVIDSGGALPDLGQQRINLYGADKALGEVEQHLAELLRQGFRSLSASDATVNWDQPRRLVGL